MIQVHLVAGLVALLAGFVALFSPKGGHLHRRSGRLFALAMAVMLGMAAIIALSVVDKPDIGIGALFTLYLVATSLVTVTRPLEASRGITAALAALAFALGLIALMLGALIVAPVAIAAAAADVRLLRKGWASETARLVRHLWRMTFALWVVTASFFLGQSKVMPEAVQNTWLLSLPVLAVLAMLVFWLVRMSKKKPRAPAARQGVCHG